MILFGAADPFCAASALPALSGRRVQRGGRVALPVPSFPPFALNSSPQRLGLSQSVRNRKIFHDSLRLSRKRALWIAYSVL